MGPVRVRPRQPSTSLFRPQSTRRRQDLVSEVMRLEHMRARVEQEIGNWRMKEQEAMTVLKRITDRLDSTYSRIAALSQPLSAPSTTPTNIAVQGGPRRGRS